MSFGIRYLSHPSIRIRESERRDCRGCGNECDKCVYGVAISPMCGVLECRKVRLTKKKTLRMEKKMRKNKPSILFKHRDRTSVAVVTTTSRVFAARVCSVAVRGARAAVPTRTNVPILTSTSLVFHATMESTDTWILNVSLSSNKKKNLPTNRLIYPRHAVIITDTTKTKFHEKDLIF